MLDHSKPNKVYLACGVTDMRKSINGLANLVQENIKLDPFEKAYFVFCNRQRNRIKILTWDVDGFWLYLKRLEKGHFKWPDATDDATMDLNHEELAQLLKAPSLEQKIKRQDVFGRKIS